MPRLPDSRCEVFRPGRGLLPWVVMVGLLLAGCGPAQPSNGGFEVTISGEAAATEGVPFPAPAGNQAPTFVDGWQVSYTHVLVSVARVTLSENPDRSATDQSQTGRAVAELKGPWIVDLARPGTLDAKEGNGRAWVLGKVANQTLVGGAVFDATQRYALGYELAAPTATATLVGDVDAGLVQQMVSRGYTVWLEGVAEWKGSACRGTDPAYDFSRLPTKVPFSLGFTAPVRYLNCLNPELSPADSKGVQAVAGAVARAQVTLHLDHPFWEALSEDAPLRFDLVAAQRSVAVGPAPVPSPVTLEDLAGVSFQAGRDAQGQPLPQRFCGPAQPGEPTTGAVSYNPAGVPVSAEGGAKGLKDLKDYMTWNLSTFGHLNNDGLCFPERQYASP